MKPMTSENWTNADATQQAEFKYLGPQAEQAYQVNIWPKGKEKATSWGDLKRFPSEQKARAFLHSKGLRVRIP